MWILAEWRRYASENFAIIGSNIGLPPGWHQAIIWTNSGVLIAGHPWEQISVKFETKYEKFHAWKW